MTCRTLRRSAFAVALTTALSLVPGGAAEAAGPRWRDATPRQTRVLEGRSILLDLWSRLVSVIGGARSDAGVVADGNG